MTADLTPILAHRSYRGHLGPSGNLAIQCSCDTAKSSLLATSDTLDCAISPFTSALEVPGPTRITGWLGMPPTDPVRRYTEIPGGGSAQPAGSLIAWLTSPVGDCHRSSDFQGCRLRLLRLPATKHSAPPDFCVLLAPTLPYFPQAASPRPGFEDIHSRAAFRDGEQPVDAKAVGGTPMVYDWSVPIRRCATQA